MSVASELVKLPLKERLECMEILWDSLRCEDQESPGWHGEILEERRRAVEEGSAELLSSDELLASIGMGK